MNNFRVVKQFGVTQEQVNWMTYELKPRQMSKDDIPPRNAFLKDFKWTVFRTGSRLKIISGKEKKYDAKSGERLVPSLSTSMPKELIYGSIIMRCMTFVVCYELLKPVETFVAKRYRPQLTRLSRTLCDKRPETPERHDVVVLQYDRISPYNHARLIATYT